MNVLNNYYEEVANKWKSQKGIGSVYCLKPFSYYELAINIINKVLAKNKDSRIFIVTDCFNTRQSIVDIFYKNNIDKDTIKILSFDYINKRYNYNYDLIILIGINNYDSRIDYLKQCTKFILSIMTKTIIDSNNTNLLNNTLPIIITSISKEDAVKAKRFSPVEEHRIAIELDDNDKKEYDKQTAFINNSMNVIGNIENIKRIKCGDYKLNLSAAEVRHNIAKSNGWSENLDMSIPFNKQIDEIYNPNALLERVCTIYEIMKNRRDLVTDNKNKLPVILDIINRHPDKQFVIISKRGEFAAEITKYLNNNNIKCGDYHDNIESAIAVDDNSVPILIKSGKDKGKPKIVCSQAISSSNLRYYNDNRLTVLSTKNASLNKLNLACFGLIITSPLCDSVIDIRNKFKEIEFNTTPNLVYTIYCNSTIEAKSIAATKETPIYKVINETEKEILYDEESGDIIL